MSFFKKLFSQKETDPALPPETPAATENNGPATESAATPTDNPAASAGSGTTTAPDPQERKFRAYDAFGRELLMNREEWLAKVLPQHLQEAWDNPELLGSTIMYSLADGLNEEMIEPAEHLVEIDPNRERSTVMLANVYTQTGRLPDAEYTLKSYLAQHGNSAVVLAHLAKVFAQQNNKEEILPTLWHSLELDPNQDNALVWYTSAMAEKDGDEAGLAALQRAAALHGSWRPQFWLARYALSQKQLEKALSFYDEILERLPRPVPTELLAQISSDLGANGHIAELLHLTTPLFDIEVHGLYVGANLLRANLSSGKVAEARALLDQFFALQRPDWQQPLAYWDTEILKAEIATAATPPPPPKMGTIMVEGPIWLRPETPPMELFPAKAEGAPTFCFLGSTVEIGATREKPQPQLSELTGRIARALPLFLAEQVHLRTPAIGTALQPWMHAPRGSYAMFSKPFRESEVALHAQASGTQCEFIFVTHLIAHAETWHFTLRMIRASNGALINATTVDFDPKQPAAAITALVELVLRLLAANAGITAGETPASYQVPTGDDYVGYVMRLEQALTVSFASIEGAGPGFLHSEREILQGSLFFCLNHPENPTARILLAYLLRTMKTIRPQAIEEFMGRVELLQQTYPLAEPAADVVKRMLDGI